MELNELKNKAQNILDELISSGAILKGLETALKELKQTVRTGHIYSFGLYTSGEYSYLCITANTSEGLQEAALNYHKLDGYSNRSLDDLETVLKWSPPDWKYHATLQVEVFEHVDDKLEELLKVTDEIMDLNIDIDERLDTIEDIVWKNLEDVLVDSLLKLNRDNPDLSEQLVYGLWKGDQSEEERQGFIKRINSQDQYEKYCKESTHGFEIERRWV